MATMEKRSGKWRVQIRRKFTKTISKTFVTKEDADKYARETEAYKKKVVAMSEGEASRFLAIYNEYKLAKRVTQERMYLETMEKVLADIDKVIIDRKAGGVVPYLPLPELTKKSKGTDTQ